MTSTCTAFFERTGDYGVIWLNRPRERNLVNREMREDLRTCLAEAADLGKTKSLRALAIAARGPFFSLGHDIGENLDDGAEEQARILEEDYLPLIGALRRLNMPKIAAVSGPAAGIGFALALACDLVYVSSRARFNLGYGNAGLVPDMGCTYFLPRKIGEARAMEMALMNRQMSATEACDWGWAVAQFPHREFEAEWRAKVTQMASMASRALDITRDLIARSLDRDFGAQCSAELEAQRVCLADDQTAAALERFRRR